MDGFQGVREVQIQLTLKLYSLYSPCPNQRFPIERDTRKCTLPLLTVLTIRHLLTCCWFYVYHLNACHHFLHDHHLLPLHKGR